MTIYTDRIVLVFPIAAKNRQAAASLQTLEISESGKEFETLIPLDPALVNQYATEFNLGFEAEKAALVSAHKSEIDAANAKIAELEAKVAALDAIKSFNPRHLASTDVFLARFTQKETKEFYASTDPVLVGGQAKFELYEKEGYYIDLDDPDVQGLTAYMVQLGKIDSMERRAVILRDATAAEAHYATV